MAEESKIIHKIKHLSETISQRMSKIIEEIVIASITILGKPPQRFALIGLGSLSRQEMTPYSDLECAILVENDTRDLQYFRNLANCIQLYVLNLGETPLPALAIKSLNDFDQADGDRFYDNITCNGFSLDGAMPWACKTPTGRPERNKGRFVKRSWRLELIRSPKNMASFQQSDIAVKQGYHLADVLNTYTLIYGSQELVSEYSVLLKSNRILTCRIRLVEKSLKDLRKYNEIINYHKSLLGPTIQNVKEQLYRFPSMIINYSNHLPLHAGNNSPWEIMENIYSNSPKKAKNIQMAISIAVLIRLITYLTLGGQKEWISFRSRNESSDIKNVYCCDNVNLMIRFISTVVPFLQYVWKTDRGSKKNTFYSKCDKTRGVIYWKAGQIDNAMKFCLKAICGLENSVYGDQVMKYSHHHDLVELHDIVGIMYHASGQYDTALKYFYNALNMLKKSYGETVHRELAVLDQIGEVYESKGDYDEAMKYYQQSLEMTKQVHGDTVHPDMAKSLKNFGSVYKHKGDYDEAMKYSQQSLEMEKKLHGDTVHPDMAKSLNNVGSVHESKGDYDEAMDYYQRSLEMTKKLHGDTVHPDIATILRNIGSVYKHKGDYDEAMKYFQQSLEMEKKVHGDTVHPEIATILRNIGTVYENIGDTVEAMKYFLQSLEMVMVILDQGIFKWLSASQFLYEVLSTITGNGNGDIGSGDKHKGDYDEAMKYFQQSLEMEKKVRGEKVHPGIAITLSSIGSVYNSKRYYDEALKYHQHSLEMRKTVYQDTVHHSSPTILSTVVSVYNDEAMKYIQQS